ncbi:pilus assembly protein TadG-related protein [Halanaerobacter jeridensis]|uniref:Putative Flp pilus-assembly TadG-like N-terminal domain-containing protein n=1 Tax=Halanaerobacter jeridensis TaxID=706427 RepID=A0A939BMR4_9FIRM|nr:pilus assembly protein TadG-related protein [Halanaerobacter jeridensis]MBM7557195.1 hypothetical protein [Halanaerobacter jeridensis]
MNRVNEEKGTVIVLVAFLMLIFLVLLALVVDVGMLYLERIELVNTLDAVVLSGVQELPDDPLAAEDIAQEYAANNGLDSGQVTINVIASNQIEATGKENVAMNFAPAIGIEEVEITSTSKAQISQVNAVTGIVPFGIVQQNFVYGESYYLKYGAGDPANAQGLNGNFGALALDGTGAKNYEDNIKHGYDSQLKVGDEVTTEPGNMSGPTRKGVEYRVDQCNHVPGCSYDTVKPDCPRLLYVPVIDDLGNGRSTSEVVGFAAFFLEGMDKEQGNSYVEGRFIKWLADSAEMGSDGQNFGLRKVKLID